MSPHDTFHRGVNVSHFMAQLQPGGRFGDPARFAMDDASWILKQGFDHIRLPVDGQLLADTEGVIDPRRLALLEAALETCISNGLGCVVELHELHGSIPRLHGTGAPLFENPDLIRAARTLWSGLARHFRAYGPALRFEVLNEPVAATTSQLDAFYDAIIEAIRGVDAGRVVVLGSNRWCGLDTLLAMRIRRDPNLVYTVHYYRPFIFTHQHTEFTAIGRSGVGSLEFPGTVPDLSALARSIPELSSFSRLSMTVETVLKDFEMVSRWARRNDLRLYVGEFGVFWKVPPDCAGNWYRAVLEAMSQNRLPWAVWDYAGGFRIRDTSTGLPTHALDAIQPFLPGQNGLLVRQADGLMGPASEGML